MKKLLVLLLGIVALILVGGVMWFTLTVSTSMSDSQVASRALLNRATLTCPSESTAVGRPWAKAGWMLFCESQGKPHGPWLAAENGKLRMRGTYTSGQPTGLWQWYDDDGKVQKRVNYDDLQKETELLQELPQG